MPITIVGSLNKNLYASYGKRFIAEFLDHAGPDVELAIVFEDGVPDQLGTAEKLTCLELADSRHGQFKKYFGHLYEANGIRFAQKRTANGQIVKTTIRDFRFNAVRFSFKIFALMLAYKSIEPGRAFAWLDADMRCLRNFSDDDLLAFMPGEGQIMSYLGRTKFPEKAPYSECGFLGFNPAHPKTPEFLERMETLYLSGEFFSKAQWHDSWLWDEVRQEFEAEGNAFKNLSGTAHVLEHPFINTGLGQFFDHLKGPVRKEAGRSFDKDYRK